MSMLHRWRSIADRIQGVAQAAQLHAQFLQVSSQDAYKTTPLLGGECHLILKEIQQLAEDYADELPPRALNRIAAFIEDRRPVIEHGTSDRPSAQASIVMMSALGAELTYLLSGEGEVLRSRAERAFLHLQQLIIADPSTRSAWQTAFAAGETACEALGAAHLLLHGIYAFKADAAGARTDLVFPEPVDTMSAARAGAGLVLTEWKIARSESEATRRYGEARRQAELYQRGLLGGVELTSHRFLVMVTTGRLPASTLPQDEKAANVIYRHINIATEPAPPSKQAKRSPA